MRSRGGAGKKRNHQGAKATLGTAKQLADTLEDANARSYLLSAIAGTQARTGEYSEAQTTVKALSSADRKAIALAHLATTILDEAKRQSDAAQNPATPSAVKHP